MSFSSNVILNVVLLFIILCLYLLYVCFLFLILNVIFSHDRSLFIFNRVLFFCLLGLIIRSPLLKPILFASDQAQTQAKIGPKPRSVWPAQLPKQTSKQAYRPASFPLHDPSANLHGSYTTVSSSHNSSFLH